METPPNPIYSKEMVDLLMRIKKHLLSHQGIAIRLSDPKLFDRLVQIHPKDDPLLHGMLQYLMALAGPEWSQIYGAGLSQGRPAPPQGASETLGKSLLQKGASLYRGLTAHPELEEKAPSAPPPPGPQGEEPKTAKPVRYYRGQPIQDD